MKPWVPAFLLLTVSASSHAQLCANFFRFCDGVSYTPESGFVWENYDCEGSDANFSAATRVEGGDVQLICERETCPVPNFFGYDLAVVTLDLQARRGTILGFENGEFAFRTTDALIVGAGACPFSPLTTPSTRPASEATQ